MESLELRIGNYYMFADYEGIVYRQVREIKNNLFGLIGDYDGTNFEICRPIPLTEEWLLKFGFHRHHADYSNDVIYIKNIDSNNGFEWGVYPNELGSGIEIKNRILLRYVHQLQNLYFALIGEELTFKIE